MDKKCVLVTVVLFLHGMLGAQLYTTTETSFVNDSVTIYGDILVPANPITPATGIAIIQGSGNSDRSNAWSAAFAKFLVANGYYVLLPDKRGTGKSGGDWKTASFEVLARDAELSVLHLKNKMQLRKTGVMGLSQGGFIAPVAASKSKAIDFVINLSGAAVTLEEQIIHEVTNTAINNGLTPNQVAEILQLHVLMKDYALNGKWEPLQSKFTELEKTPMAAFVKTFPSSRELWVWSWIRMNIRFDPIPYWRVVKQPVFIAFGAKDETDNLPVYESVYRLQKTFHEMGKTNYQVNVYATGHALYEDDAAELRKELLNDLLTWLKQSK